MIDVLILYEHRNRELENACLLAVEMERRGYTVKIQCIYSLSKYFTKAKVLVVPHLYNDYQVLNFGKNFWKSNQTIIDMQYEQVLSKNERNGVHDPKGQAMYAQHTSWGEAQKEIYLSKGIAEENVHVVGHLAMDLMRPEFDGCFQSRDEIAKEFELCNKSKWVLFISTFAYKEKTKQEREVFEKITPGLSELINQSIKAQNVIVDWLMQAAKDNPDKLFIYRRHPAEREDPMLIKIQSEIPNFRCIDKYSIRQWIRVADKFYTWYSTSIADAYYGKRMCYILRPEPVPKGFEVEIMEGADVLTEYEEFVESLNNDYDKFPISDEVMKYYYGNDRKNVGAFAFMKMADLCELAIKSEEMRYAYDYGDSRIDMCNCGNWKMIIKAYVHALLFELCTKIKFRIPVSMHKNKILKKIVYYGHEGYNYKRDIRGYKKKFSKFIENMHR